MDQKNKKSVAQEGLPFYSHHKELKCGRKQAALTLFRLALQKKSVGQWLTTQTHQKVQKYTKNSSKLWQNFMKKRYKMPPSSQANT
eukprot:12170363-Ditylum_brightwellii.AAC.1